MVVDVENVVSNIKIAFVHERYKLYQVQTYSLSLEIEGIVGFCKNCQQIATLFCIKIKCV